MPAMLPETYPAITPTTAKIPAFLAPKLKFTLNSLVCRKYVYVSSHSTADTIQDRSRLLKYAAYFHAADDQI